MICVHERKEQTVAIVEKKMAVCTTYSQLTNVIRVMNQIKVI